ncbi:MAG: nucleotide sugar dehydrogenase [Thermodesulfobacteriota bacterium]
MRFSVIGLGKLGASMAAAIADRGFEVVGVDVNKKAVDAVNAGLAPIQETRLEETIARNGSRIRATLDHQEAIVNSDLSFVIVPTPSDENGAFSLQYARWAFREIGRALAVKKGYHNVVLTSTVLPGSTRYGLQPILESESGKTCGKDFGLCYSPEFIALGSILHNFLNPDFTLIGEFDSRCGSQLEECYAQIMENKPPCKRMSLENAELTKISVNTFVTAKIAFANMLAELCEKIPGGDVDVVTDALGADSRIGMKYLKGGLGYGGPCFPRDNVALGFIARELGVKASLAETTDQSNRHIPERLFRQIKNLVRKGSTIAILGLAYKPMSHVIEESQSIALAKSLAGSGERVIGFDPLAGETARAELAYDALVLDSLDTCLEQADTVLITTPDPVFKKLKAADFRHRPVTVVDFWRILDQELSGVSGITYVPVGRSVSDAANAAQLRQIWGNDKK